MVNKRTVIVVGAGASHEAKLPTGQELKTTIAKMLDIRFEYGQLIPESGDRIVFSALYRASAGEDGRYDFEPYRLAAQRIIKAMPLALSIDQFVDMHDGDEELELCAKVAIVRSILDAERRSKLWFDPSHAYAGLNFKGMDGTWFQRFFQLVTENCKLGEIEHRFKDIVLIVFNYDRCIEHFLYHALQALAGFGGERAAEIVRGLEIYHPYGTVGMLDWEIGATDRIPFGGELEGDKLLRLASQIRTFTEGTDSETSRVQEIRDATSGAELVLFLGFAYHPKNLELIMPAPREELQPEGSGFECFGTAKGFSQHDRDTTSARLQELMNARNGQILLSDHTCAQLFDEYWRTLALS